jgi:hypothetical protein
LLELLVADLQEICEHSFNFDALTNRAGVATIAEEIPGDGYCLLTNRADDIDETALGTDEEGTVRDKTREN